MNATWKTTEAPKDGTRLVAVGRVFYEEEAFTTVEPFCAAIQWESTPSGYTGWIHDSGLAVARCLGDEVMVDFWLEYPTGAALVVPAASAAV